MTAYVTQRQAAGAANGTCNRELGVLGKLLRLAYKQNKLARVPAFSYLKEAAPRQGFFEQEQFEAVRERRQLDLEAGTLRLDLGATKNGDGRVGVPHPGADGAAHGPGGARGGPPASPRPHHPVALSPSLRAVQAGGMHAGYRRYAIVSDADLQEAARKLAGKSPGTNAGADVLRPTREITKS